jgi:hypothetical protein
MEFIAGKDGALRRVVSVGAELVPFEEWQRREARRAVPRCACGKPCGSGSARTCGDRERIDTLTASRG